MEAMLALVLDLSGWRGPVAFGSVGIFVVAALARFISWSSSRRRRRMWLAEGYKSREDVRLALREENIEDWLEKMRSTPVEYKVSKPIPEAGLKGGGAVFDLMDAVGAAIKDTSKGIEEIVSLKKSEQAALTLSNYGPEVILKGEPELLFTWYRMPQGAILCRMAGPGPAGMARFLTPSSDEVMFPYEGLRVAYPLVGEWWSKLDCSVHKVESEVRLRVEEGFSWYRSPGRIAELYCGCLVPMNFGKGFEKVAGSEYLEGAAGSNGGSEREGFDGVRGITGVQNPEKKCTHCAGEGKVVQTVDGAARVVPCPRCNGFCWEP